MNIHEGDVNSHLEAEATARQLELVSLDGEVILRQYSIADAPAAFALIDRNRKHLSKYGDSTARKYPTLESFQRSIEHPKNPDRLRMGIWNKDGELVGSINLTPQTEDQHLGEVGYYLGEEFQGHGYATRAVETLTDYAIGEGGFHTVFGDVHKRNNASAEVLLAAGYADHDWSEGKNKYYAYADHIAIRRQPGTNIADGVNTQPYPWKRIMTDELSDLARETVAILGNDVFEQIIETFQRFKKPGNFVKESWEQSRGWFLKWVLEQVPTYVDATKNAKLSEAQMQDLLLTVVGASPYDTHNNNSELIILGRALGEIAEREIELTELDIRRIKTMIKLGGKDGIVSSYLNAFEHAIRIGLPVQDSTKIISHFSIADVWVHPGYAISPFLDALKALKTTGISPESAKYVFGEIEKLPRHTRGDAYTLLEHAVTFACPSRRITPQELIDAYRAQGSSGTIIDLLGRFIENGQNNLLGEQEPDIINPSELKDKYFLPKKGKLEHSATPYQVKRSLDEGIQDLQELANARFYRFEEVAEGFWVFDPNTSTWYSFGGKTEIVERAIRHEFLPYDISELTDQPYLFHVHNAEFDNFLIDHYSDFPPRQFREQEKKFLMATPSRADYAAVADLMRKAKNGMQLPRSFIAHTLGVTEFTYPSDLESLNDMVDRSREIRDQVVLDFDWYSLFLGDEATGVAMLVDALNKILPEGFSDKLN